VAISPPAAREIAALATTRSAAIAPFLTFAV
jgi:hypothetical protein